jgi:hypothetical protein
MLTCVQRTTTITDRTAKRANLQTRSGLSSGRCERPRRARARERKGMGSSDEEWGGADRGGDGRGGGGVGK